MSYVSTGELAQLRADALKTLADETCTILTPTYGVNGIGEQTITWGTAGTAVACRLRSVSGASWDTTANRPVAVAGWMITLPQGTAVAIGDRIVVDSITYEVTNAIDEETWVTATRAEVKRLETG